MIGAQLALISCGHNHQLRNNYISMGSGGRLGRHTGDHPHLQCMLSFSQLEKNCTKTLHNNEDDNLIVRPLHTAYAKSDSTSEDDMMMNIEHDVANKHSY